MLELWRSWRTQKRILGALFMREIQVRWGRRNLGFVWIFAEPLLFAFPVLLMWTALRGPFEHGLRLVPFLWSGYLPILMFRHVTGGAIQVVSTNAHIMYHKAITPFDIIFGHCGLELVGNIAALTFSFFLLYTLGVIDWPAYPALFIVGNLYMAWWSFSVALIVAAASERTHLVMHIWPPISYMYLPVCGFFFLAEWLPTSLRHAALMVDPPLHAYEMIRGGLFGHQIHAYYDAAYLSYILAVLSIVGLWLVRDVRRHLELIE